MKNNYSSKNTNKSNNNYSKKDRSNISYLHLHNNYHNHNHDHLQNITKWKDQRLELVDIPKGLIEILQNTGFTVEKILDNEPSHIAEILGIDDDYIGELIYQETRKTTRNYISNSNF